MALASVTGNGNILIMRNEIEQLLRNGERLEAIYQVRAWRGCDYRTAREYVNAVAFAAGLFEMIA